MILPRFLPNEVNVIEACRPDNFELHNPINLSFSKLRDVSREFVG